MATRRIALLCIASTIGFGAAPEFEVASIKPSAADGPARFRSRIKQSANGLTMQNVALSDCIVWAYQVQLDQITKRVSVDGNKRYGILTRTAGPVSIAQMRLMLRQLLAERFKLSLHHEIKNLPVYELTIAKKGPKLPPPRNDVQDHVAERTPRFIDDVGLFFDDTSMEEFAAKLSILREISRPVIDKTGITGYYDFAVKSASTVSPDGTGTSPFTAIEEQLGLKLVPAKAEVDTIVIDHVENPSEN